MPGSATPAEDVSSTSRRSGCRGAEEVYAPLSGVETGDLTKRGGRYTPEFIWNVKWQDQVLALYPAAHRSHPLRALLEQAIALCFKPGLALLLKPASEVLEQPR